MRIIIDLQACQSGSRLGGIGRYSLHLATALAQLCAAQKQYELRIVLNDLMPTTIPDLYHHFAALLPHQQIQVLQLPGPVAEHDANNHARARVAELLREHAVCRLAPDILHIASLIEGLSDDVVSSIGAVPALTPQTIVTLYDLIPLVDQARYLQNPLVRTHYYRKLDAVKRAGGLVAISEFSRQQAIDVLGIAPDRIVNIAAGVDPRFQPLTIHADHARAIRQRYGIHRNIILYTSSFDRRKNQARLIEAFAQLSPVLKQRYQLVIVGNGWDAIYRELYQVAQRVGLTRHDVIFTGRISDDELLTLYNLAHLFVFPSLSEGYGLPVLEAMACGLPTIASNTTSIPEVVGRADALFDPTDVSSIAVKMQQVLTDDGLREQLREHGLIHSRQFTWTASAQRALDFFNAHHARVNHTTAYTTIDFAPTLAALRALGTPALPLNERIPIAAALAANERCLIDVTPATPRIGWVTPWNTRCGVAMYSRYLTGAHQADYWIFAPYESQPPLPDEPNVIRCWHSGRDDLRQLIEQLAVHQITTVVIQFNYGLFDFPSTAVLLRELIATGRRVFITFHSTTDTVDKHLTQLAAPLALCDAILVHTPRDQHILAQLGLAHRTELFPHGVPDIAPASVNCTIPAGRFIIATYGFFLPHKGLLEILAACELLVKRDQLDVHLLMINAEYPVAVSATLIAEAKRFIRAAGLENRVTLITDFLPDAVSLGWLHYADFICYPYQHTGESSSAAVRMGLAAQRPVAVTPLPIFADVCDAVITLPGTSVADLAAGMAALMPRLRAPDAALNATRTAATTWLAAHRYSVLAEQMWQRLHQPTTLLPAAHNAL